MPVIWPAVLGALLSLTTWWAPDSTEAGPVPWGRKGHEIAAQVAIATVPDEVPAFFRDAEARLVWLDPEPDRWHGPEMTAMDRAWSFDHYVDMENLPDGALEAPDRFTYLAELYAAGLDDPARDGGFLPYRILELYERLATGWRRWRVTPDDAPEKRWIEERIIDDAGLLGHYVTDGSQPHHTTIHFNGWAPGAPNPDGFPTDRSFHVRFESRFVDAHVSVEDVSTRVRRVPSSVVGDVYGSILDFLGDSHARVDDLYRLDRDVGFEPNTPAQPETHAFASDRLAAGSEMLASLWWSAWLEGR
jgi:hypothetical protein